MANGNLGTCATDQAVRKITFKKNPKTGKISKVIKITHTQKCSQDKELVSLEEKEDKTGKPESEDDKCDQQILNDSEEASDETEETEDKDMEAIREGFRRFLRT